ncbi:MAG: hypothetical protein ACUVXI_01190 [bacterium]
MSLLLVIGLLVSGFLAASSYLISRWPVLEGAKNTLSRWQTYIGLATMALGIWRLLFARPPIFGNLIPSASAILVGLLLSMSFLKTRESLPRERLEAIESKLTTSQVPLGFISIGAGILHIFLGKRPLF